MKWNPHLSFNGDCQAAFQFYEHCFGGRILAMLTYGETPMARQAPTEWSSKILHATLIAGSNVLMRSDDLPGQSGTERLPCGDWYRGPAEAERIFHSLAENGKVLMPIQKTFWAVRFGVLVDRFGVPWEINCEQASP